MPIKAYNASTRPLICWINIYASCTHAYNSRMCATRDGVLILLRTGPIRAPHPSALAGTAFSAWPSHLSNWCLQLTQMILKVKDTSVMLREGGTPGGSNLGSSSVMVAPRPTGPRSLTVTPIGSSQHLRCCETGVIHHDAGLLKMVPGPTPRDLSGTINASLASPR